jgi:peptide/nickel transport system ATP-binding protein
VMYAGRTAEYGPAGEIFSAPQHPYAWGLLGSMPRLDRERTDRLLPIKGTPPSLINVPTGCAFHPRCAYPKLNGNRCYDEVPELREVDGKHTVSCHLSAEDRLRLWDTEIRPNL